MRSRGRTPRVSLQVSIHIKTIQRRTPQSLPHTHTHGTVHLPSLIFVANRLNRILTIVIVNWCGSVYVSVLFLFIFILWRTVDTWRLDGFIRSVGRWVGWLLNYGWRASTHEMIVSRTKLINSSIVLNMDVFDFLGTQRERSDGMRGEGGGVDSRSRFIFYAFK